MSHSTATGALGSVITALSSDPEFARRFRESFIAPKVAVSRDIYLRAIERGEIAADVDIDVIAPALAGILLHRSFVLGIVPDDATVERVIDHVILPAVSHPAAGPRLHQQAGDPGRSTTPDSKKKARNP